jgi:oligopeptidase B
VGLDANPDPSNPKVLVGYESFVTPGSVLEIDLATGDRELIKQQPVLADFDASRYVQHRAWANAQDGTRVPVSIVRRTDVPADGRAPGLLTAYGAYEISSDPYFSVARLSVLDRGVVYAVAHVRGGGEMGRHWYDHGKLLEKPNTFSDTVAAARLLGDEGWVDPKRLGLEGGSAGGLLVGAVVNQAPELFRVAHASVPFVDALNTILRPELPLTIGEWEEWGNPIEDPEVYACMKAYTPYENVTARDYPAILATTRPARHPRLLHRAGQMGGAAAGDGHKRPGDPTHPAAHRDGSRARRSQRPVCRVGADRVGVVGRARPTRRD